MARNLIIFKMKVLPQGSGSEAQFDDVVDSFNDHGEARVRWPRSAPIGLV